MTGLYLVLLSSLIVSDFGLEFDNEKIKHHIPAMSNIIEHVICQLGIGLKELNKNVINYFSAEMNSII